MAAGSQQDVSGSDLSLGAGCARLRYLRQGPRLVVGAKGGDAPPESVLCHVWWDVLEREQKETNSALLKLRRRQEERRGVVRFVLRRDPHLRAEHHLVRLGSLGLQATVEASPQLEGAVARSDPETVARLVLSTANWETLLLERQEWTAVVCELRASHEDRRQIVQALVKEDPYLRNPETILAFRRLGLRKIQVRC